MNSLNLEHARNNMIQQQLRPWEIIDNDVLNAMQSVPREDFVPLQYRQLAYADLEIPIAAGATMLFPVSRADCCRHSISNPMMRRWLLEPAAAI